MNESSDQHARTRILEELNTTFLVEAGAGSGKTTSLVGRLLALIETGTAKIEQIAAITFTNKAADEMKERFRIALERKAADVEGETRGRLEEALANLDQIFIGTIHAFCSSMLRERPIEAGLDPSFEEMDEEMNRAFHDQCWDEYLIRLICNFIDRRANVLDIEAVWANVLTHEGEVFRQIRGGEFTFQVKGNIIYPDRTNVQISKNQLQEALAFFPLSNTTQIQHLRGPSYIYAILMDQRIHRT